MKSSLKSSLGEKLYYSISEVSRLTDLEQYVLRYWETEFSQLKPAKNSSGNRIYTNREIKLILLIKKLLIEEKYTIAGAKKILQDFKKIDEKGESVFIIEPKNSSSGSIVIITNPENKSELLKAIQNIDNSSEIFSSLLESTDLSINFLAENVFEMTPKTLSKYKNENVKMTSLISEQALKLKSLFELGIEVFGSKAEFSEWLKDQNIGLGYKKPAELLNTSTGIDLIYEELKRIEFGATA